MTGKKACESEASFIFSTRSVFTFQSCAHLKSISANSVYKICYLKKLLIYYCLLMICSNNNWLRPVILVRKSVYYFMYMTEEKKTSIEMPVHEITGHTIGGCYFIYFYFCPVFFVCPVVRSPSFCLFHINSHHTPFLFEQQ
jgi:hypothetical protein